MKLRTRKRELFERMAHDATFLFEARAKEDTANHLIAVAEDILRHVENQDDKSIWREIRNIYRLQAAATHKEVVKRIRSYDRLHDKLLQEFNLAK